jgi:hypothetical protein
MVTAFKSPVALRAPSKVKVRSTAGANFRSADHRRTNSAHVNAVACSDTLGFSDGAQEPRPADGVVDGVMDVAVGLVRCDHGPTCAGERPQVILCASHNRRRAVGAGAFRLPGDTSHQPIEHEKGGVCQIGFETERRSHERRPSRRR